MLCSAAALVAAGCSAENIAMSCNDGRTEYPDQARKLLGIWQATLTDSATMSLDTLYVAILPRSAGAAKPGCTIAPQISYLGSRHRASVSGELYRVDKSAEFYGHGHFIDGLTVLVRLETRLDSLYWAYSGQLTEVDRATWRGSYVHEWGAIRRRERREAVGSWVIEKLAAP